MRRGSLALRVLALALGLIAARSSAAQEEIRVKGSDTIGAKLGQDLARSYAAEHEGVRIQWDSLGSNTAFVSLLDGSADLGASSRPINAEEIAEARRLGIELSEYVIGFDAIAVIVHPSNPLSELSLAQLADLFTGRTTNWRTLGGRDANVERMSLPRYSGTEQVFADRVMRSEGGGTDKFPDNTRFVEDGREVVRRVTQNPRAIGYVGMGFVVDSPVKTLAVIQPGRTAVLPSARTIHDGSYPLRRTLYLYSRGEPRGRVAEFLAYVLSAQGQQRVAQSRLIPRDMAAPLGALQEASSAAPASTPEAPTRISFQPNSTRLSKRDQLRMDELLPSLLDGSHFLLITGHADGMEPRTDSARYARQRADLIARYYRGKGVPAEQIETRERAETEPVASNESDVGREQNRRVDLLLLPVGQQSKH